MTVRQKFWEEKPTDHHFFVFVCPTVLLVNVLCLRLLNQVRKDTEVVYITKVIEC